MVAALFGEAGIERHPELAEMVDFRQDAMERSGEGDETTPEIDETVGEAPDIGLPDPADERDQQSQLGEVLDYLVEHTRVHLSPVVARSLRIYKERGTFAMAAELLVTRPPQDTGGTRAASRGSFSQGGSDLRRVRAVGRDPQRYPIEADRRPVRDSVGTWWWEHRGLHGGSG